MSPYTPVSVGSDPGPTRTIAGGGGGGYFPRFGSGIDLMLGEAVTSLHGSL